MSNLLAKGNRYISVAYQLLRKQEEICGGFTPKEEQLWQAAIGTPYGGIIIGREGDPYLLRAFLIPEDKQTTGLFGVYLHFFFRGDSDENPHNHPWGKSSSTILTGGYTEYVLGPDKKEFIVRKRVPGGTNTLYRNTFHRVELLEPKRGCWTLFTSGGRVAPSQGEDWGFYDIKAREFVGWADYFAREERAREP